MVFSSSWGLLAWIALALGCSAPAPRPGQRADEPRITRGPVEAGPAPGQQAGGTERSPVAAEPVRAPVEIALTFDDLPRHGEDIPGLSRTAIHEALLRALGEQGLPPTYGFVNGKHLEEHPEDRAALAAWIAAGNPLGNHTYSHSEPNRIGLTAYLADIDRNELLLAELAGPGREREWKVFRYPYLREGADASLRGSIRRHLLERGYRIAQVTIDFYDWSWNAPHARCVKQGDEASVGRLRQGFLGAGIAGLRWSVSAAEALVGRPIKHVLMLHVGALTAEMMDELIAAYRAEGVRFIPLDEALRDGVYAVDTGVVQERGDALLEQMQSRQPSKHAPHPERPEGALRQMCR
ncbi:MAG: polysaccharide deacetylase family protein [Polyangiaceae bacterium]|nr:polysaccharide deacetylase family protein [Polyangiaceae bacterium]